MIPADSLTVWLLAAAAGILAAGMIVVDHLRWQSVFLGLIYALGAVLLSAYVPLLTAAGKGIAGLVAVLIITATARRLQLWRRTSDRGLLSGRLFRVLSMVLVLLAAWGMQRSGWVGFLDLPEPVSLAGHWLLMLGVLEVGLSRDPFRIGAGLLTMFLGFDVIFTSVEPSLAVQGLLAAVHLSIAVLASYLLTVRGRVEQREAAG